MPAIASTNSTLLADGLQFTDNKAMAVTAADGNDSSPLKRRLRSDSANIENPNPCTPSKWKSPRRCLTDSPNSPANAIPKIENVSGRKIVKSKISLVQKLSEIKVDEQKWNPKDPDQMSALKDTLHVSKAPSTIVCREQEQSRITDFCKICIEDDKSGSLYVCGCPGTGKSWSMGRVLESIIDWRNQAGLISPEVLTINCTTLTSTSEIFRKILDKVQPQRKAKSAISPLQHLQSLYSQKQSTIDMKLLVIVADELDYLITKDRAVLHDLFMLTTYPFSRCILIGVANSIDLADRFLPKLQSLNCKPLVITFRAYSKDQILKILQQRLNELPYNTFQQQALELCARKVASASGDMRRALCICRTAIEILEAELNESNSTLDMGSEENVCPNQLTVPAHPISLVRVDHMAVALSKAFKSPVVDIIQSLPQHQQIVLCSAVKLFRKGKKETTLGEVIKSYMDICKLIRIPPVGITDLSSMCRVLGDQGLLKVGQSREERLRKVSLKVDEADVSFALQGVRVFRSCLQL